MGQPCSIWRRLVGMETMDGAGVKLRRFIGTRELLQQDPFLLLDAFYSDDPESYIAGFPDHPHRGFETVTYLIAGKMAHRDSYGNHGLLLPGGAQFMRAGRGIIHSEMPQQEQGLLWGYQLWVNLPAREKMSQPRYQDIQAEEIPLVEHDGARIKVISGVFNGVQGPAQGFYPLDYWDIEVPASAKTTIPVADDKTVLVVVVTGEGKLGGENIAYPEVLLLTPGDLVALESRNNLRVLLMAARPIGEPIARYGPFVMNTHSEILQALEDLEKGVLGRRG
ncbi:MAG: pirin family protein [Turneriella sp.]|nr:pirin family protein [Turneriella sp.]